MGHPIAVVPQRQRDAAGNDHDLEHDVIEPVTGKRGVGTFHRFTLHVVVPFLRSSSSMPWAASSSRTRSASLKSLALRAALRAEIRLSVREKPPAPSAC